MSKRDRLLLLQDMLIAIHKIFSYVDGMNYEGFVNDNKTIDAVIRNFEIIGEAANRIDEDFKIAQPELEWNRLRGLRNRIVHDYFGVDLEIIFSIINNDLERYKDSLEQIIMTENS
jgi:uncharacterized protein with HEPN domain